MLHDMTIWLETFALVGTTIFKTRREVAEGLLSLTVFLVAYFFTYRRHYITLSYLNTTSIDPGCSLAAYVDFSCLYDE
jgi:hypothetical protein